VDAAARITEIAHADLSHNPQAVGHLAALVSAGVVVGLPVAMGLLMLFEGFVVFCFKSIFPDERS
jgi:uncharacterized membrane protein